MKMFLLLCSVLLFTELFEGDSDGFTTLVEADDISELPLGTYVWDESTKDVWNDSIQVYPDKLIVFKDERNGYGRIFRFVYSYHQLNDDSLMLYAESMYPEGVYVLPEQYPWHKRTLQVQFLENQTTKLLGPDSEAYILRVE